MKKNYAKGNGNIFIASLFISIIVTGITCIIICNIKGSKPFFDYYYIVVIALVSTILIGLFFQIIYDDKIMLDLKDLYIKTLTSLYGSNISVKISEEIVDLGDVASINNKRKKFNFKAYIPKYNCTINNFDLEELREHDSDPSSYTPIYHYQYMGNYIEYIYPLTRNDLVINENILNSLDNKISAKIIDSELVITKKINSNKYLYDDVLNDLKDVAKYYDLIICNLEIDNNINKENLDNKKNNDIKKSILNLTPPKFDIAISAIVFLIVSVCLLFVMPFSILSVVKIILCEAILILAYLIISFADIRFAYLVIFVAYTLCILIYTLI